MSDIGESWTFCSQNLNVAHDGHNVYACHVVTNSRLEFAKAAAKIKNVLSYFKKIDPELNVINAESFFARIIIEPSILIYVYFTFLLFNLLNCF